MTAEEQGSMADELLFAAEDEQFAEGARALNPWKVLVVDDEEEVHQATRLVLSDFEFEGRKLEFISAYSGQEAKKAMEDNLDTALILLDVVMENPQAGLDVVRHIRREVQNRLVRIILRTGQPGQAPEREVITDYDINDYKQKTDLTSTKLFTTVTTAIRSYRDLVAVDEARRAMNLLAMSVAHQIRNRTVAIAGFANILKRNATMENGNSKYLESIVEESGRLEGVVGAVSAYSSCGPADPQVMDVLPVVETALERFEGKCSDMGAAFEIERHLAMTEVLADGELLAIALESLLNNVLDFARQGELVINLGSDSSGISLEILDRGPGIPEVHLAHIFDPLFSTKPDGVGMGLCMVRKVALEHGWDVEVVNRPRGGVRASIVMPHLEEQ